MTGFARGERVGLVRVRRLGGPGVAASSAASRASSSAAGRSCRSPCQASIAPRCPATWGAETTRRRAGGGARRRRAVPGGRIAELDGAAGFELLQQPLVDGFQQAREITGEHLAAPDAVGGAAGDGVVAAAAHEGAGHALLGGAFAVAEAGEPQVVTGAVVDAARCCGRRFEQAPIDLQQPLKLAGTQASIVAAGVWWCWSWWSTPSLQRTANFGVFSGYEDEL